MLRYALALTAGALLAGPAFAQETACDLDRPIVFAGLNWGSAQFHTAVAQYILEHGYGCEVDAIPGDTIPLINGVANGDADVIMEIWMANPAQAWVDAADAGQAVPLGTSFPDATEAWYIPAYLVEGDDAPAAGVETPEDLADHKDLFADPEEPGKGRFYNCPSGWACETTNTKKLHAYGLDDDFTDFKPGTGAALDAAVESELRQQDPVFFYMFGPSWILGKYNDQLVKLEEPAFNQEAWDALQAAEDPEAVEEATSYPVSEVVIGANAEFVESAPVITDFLESYSGNNATTSQGLAYMQDNDASAEEAAAEFLRTNEDMWTGWVPADVAERVGASLGQM